MKYLEELKPGSSFRYNNQLYLLTCDFKAQNYKLTYSLISGTPSWLSPDSIVAPENLYTLDENNNIAPVKIDVKENY